MKPVMKTAFLFLVCALALPANQITLTGPLTATANFVFSDGSFTVTLTNLTTTNDAADLLTDLIFSLSATGPATYQSATGQLVIVDSAGVVTTDTTAIPNWGFGVYNSLTLPQFNGQYLLCTVCGAGVTAPFQPAQGILGPGGGTGPTPYSTANGSIKGNAPHNPFFAQSATFSFTGSSITAETVASNVFFSFGTAFGVEIPGGGGGGGGGEVPEPVTMVLTGAALVGLGLARRRRAS